MSASATFTRPVGHLGASLHSKVVLPGDERFDEARRAWNLAIDQRPARSVLDTRSRVLGRWALFGERGSGRDGCRAGLFLRPGPYPWGSAVAQSRAQRPRGGGVSR